MRGNPLDFLRSYTMHGRFVFKISCTSSLVPVDHRRLYQIRLFPPFFVINRCVSKQWSSLIQINHERVIELFRRYDFSTLGISPNFHFFLSSFFFSNTFLTNFFHYTRDSSKTRVSYIISPRSSLSLLISASHVSDNLTVKKKKKKKNSYQFLRWPFAIGCARTAGE